MKNRKSGNQEIRKSGDDEGRTKLLHMAIHPVTRAYALPALECYRPDVVAEFHSLAKAADGVMSVYFAVEKDLKLQRESLGIASENASKGGGK